MDRGAWWATVHWVPKSWTWLSDWTDWTEWKTNVQDVLTAYFPSTYLWYNGSSNLLVNLSFWWVGMCFLTAEFWKFFVYSVCCCCCLIAKSYPTLWDPVDCSPPGSSVHGVLQAIILEWVALSSSRGSSWPRDQTCISWALALTGRMSTT